MDPGTKAADEAPAPESPPGEAPFSAIEATFKRAVAALDDAGVPFLLGGGIASWALGGAESTNDLDLMIKPDDLDAAVDALTGCGMRPDDPPEPWLAKVWDGNVLVDLIHHPKGIEITDDVIERGLVRDVAAMRVKVMAPEDIIVSKLLALGEHALDLEGPLQIARALREQIDWTNVSGRVAGSPYARAFLALARELGIFGPSRNDGADRPVVRVVTGESHD